jgi:hypothetical protein
LFGKGLEAIGLDQKHNVDEEILSNFIIGGIIRVVQRLEDDELSGFIDAPHELYWWI